MILINNTEVNLVYLTLNESVSITNPVYTFIATSEATLQDIDFVLTVLESNDRWDVCEIDGTLFNEGQYKYSVKVDDEVIESGMMVVTDGDLKGYESVISYNGTKKYREYKP